MDSFANDRVVDVTDARLSNEHPTPTPPVSPAALRRAAEVYDAAPRAEDVLPSGFFPAPVSAAAREGMTAAERALAEVDAVRGSLASMHLLHDAGILTPQGLTGFLGAAGGHLRNLRVLLAAMALAAVAVVGLGVPGGTWSAEAAVTRVQPAPALVVLDRAVVEVPMLVTTTVPNEAGQFHAAMFSGARTMSFLGEAWSPRATQTLVAYVDARTIPLGAQTWTTVDRNDASDTGTLTHRVKVVRQTHVSVPFISKVRGGWVVYDVQVSHYDVRSGRYLGAALSPVVVQGLVHGRWVNLGRTVTTDTTGKTVGIVDASTASRVRFVRPLGARDNAGTSPAYKPLDRGTLIP